ncbi:MAG TPA: hypothetical protein DCS43_05725 [Verrucomicrobia bacterium]|nr:hypothetical protein [Verrucomicrobiota bacterium]
MSTALSDIKRRIATTAQIKKVTGTLQKVAAAKLSQEQRRLANADAFSAQLQDLLGIAADALPRHPHPLLKPSCGDAIALFILGSDRGLCGSFNALLIKALPAFLAQHPDQTVHLMFRGKVTYNRALRLQFPSIESIDAIEGQAPRLMDAFLNGQFRAVYVMYWDFINRARQRIETRQLLPAVLKPADHSTRRGDAYCIEPSPQALIDSLLPEFISRQVYNAVHKSAAAEHAQRQAAMSRATENAGELLDTLRKQYSRLRQDSITTEMLEIVAGMYR